MNKVVTNKVWFSLLMLGIFSSTSLLAQDVIVEALLSNQQAAVGEPVQMQIVVQGAKSAKIPDNFAVDGLDIVFAGQSSNFSMVNFQVSVAVTYSFLVTPKQEGSFTIPSLAVEVGGEIFRTQPLQLRVLGMSGRTPRAQTAPQPPGMQGNPFRPAPSQQSPDPTNQSVPLEQVAFLELIVPETEVYVGQVVPVEIRLYLDRRFSFELTEMPTFSGEGFTVEKLSEPVERQQDREGVPYQVVSFYSSITSVKSGPIAISPARMNCQVITRSSGGRGSLFDDFFGGTPFGGEKRRLELESNSLELKARPLPREGRPLGFNGAIGQFSMDLSVNPPNAEVGEPIKLTASISGQGNFSAITPPLLEESEDWRVYPGSDQFTPTDSIGFGGKKDFQFTIMAMKETDKTPPVTFHYFDPVTSKYVTLNGESQPVQIRGGKAPPPTPAPVASAASSPRNQAQTTQGENADGVEEDEKPEPAEITIVDTWRPGSFVPMIARKEFLIANGAAAVAFLCVAIYMTLLARQRSASGRIDHLRKIQRKLLRKMETPDLEVRSFYETATEFLQNQLRIQSKNPEAMVDEYQWTSDPQLDPDLRKQISLILEQRNELKFASSARPPSPQQRQEAIEALRLLGKQHS